MYHNCSPSLNNSVVWAHINAKKVRKCNLECAGEKDMSIDEYIKSLTVVTIFSVFGTLWSPNIIFNLLVK